MRKLSRLRFVQRLLLVVALGLAVCLPCLAAPPAEDSLKDLKPVDDFLKEAAPGTTVVLPAGTFRGPASLPAGVGLKGAGFDKTIIDAGGAQIGLAVADGNNVEISDLTVRGAMICNLVVKNAVSPRISRVRVTGANLGMSFVDVQGGRIENAIIAHNVNGLAVSGGKDNVVVNCTIADNSDLGLSLPSGQNTIVFNNCITGNKTGVYLGGEPNAVQMDYNLYCNPILGKMAGEVSRLEVASWRFLTNQDSHSLTLPVEFDASGSYRPTRALSWAQDRAATGDWGAAEFAKTQAPQQDIVEANRVGAPDVGAYEISPEPSRPGDGNLVIRSSGLTSAGIFTRDGHEVAYLFHNLPMAKGEYKVWFPARDFQGQPIGPGKYEIRVVQSNLQWDYLGAMAPALGNEPVSQRHPLVAFDTRGHLLLADSASDDFVNLRDYDPNGKVRPEPKPAKPASAPASQAAKTASTSQAASTPASGPTEGRRRPVEQPAIAVSPLTPQDKVAETWHFAGGDFVRGLAVGSDGMIYLLRLPAYSPGDEKRVQMSRIDPNTGKLFVRIDPNTHKPADANYEPPQQFNVDLSEPAGGMAQLGGKLFAYDANAKAIRFGEQGAATFAGRIDAPAVTALAADEKAGVLWAISNQKLLAMSADGKKLAELQLVPQPVAIAARDGKLAVASAADGKVHVFDVADPAAAKETAVLGSGEEPYGLITAKKFFFKPAGTWKGCSVALALGPAGEMAVAEMNRVIVFDGNGQFLWEDAAGFGGAQKPGGERVFSADGRLSALSRFNRWIPEAFWETPLSDATFCGGFMFKAAHYGVFLPRERDMLLVRYDAYRAKPILEMGYDPALKIYCRRTDTNGDGVIDEKDTAQPLLEKDGNVFMGFSTNPSVPSPMDFNGRTVMTWSGDLCTLWGMASVWPSGDEESNRPVPTYDFTQRHRIPVGAVRSPYTGAMDSNLHVTAAVPTWGGWLLNVRLPSDGNYLVGMDDACGSNLLGLDDDDNPRWFNPSFIHRQGAADSNLQPERISGLLENGGICLTGRTTSTDVLAFSPDGLGLGGFGMPAPSRMMNIRAEGSDLGKGRMYRGRDGRTYAQIMTRGPALSYCFVLKNSNVGAWTTFVTLDEEQAKVLSSLPADGGAH